ncbi:MAG TPA: phosphate ABC transporter substrate-binding protein PstS [Candidatus Angelobacter sp.]|nr:phosphate ABC transporter substrate-binding protein PstS [Candidatus Angelobacter sp.]
MRSKFPYSLAASAALLLLAPAGVHGQQRTVLVETGSSMPEPLYKDWINAYRTQDKTTDIRYMPVGSAESARNVLAGSGDFGGGDAPIPDAQLRAAGKSIVELPAVLIGIVVIYELPDVQGELRLTGPVLANIFLGKIKVWNDPAIARLNPDMSLPALPIQVFHRNEGKGSNYILSDYLAKESPEFLPSAGRSESPKWPVGESFQRSQELVASLKVTPGAIGYTELNLAVSSGARMASIKNAAGEFIKPSAKSIEAAASSSGNKMSDDFRVSLTNAPGKESYPISSFTWLYVPVAAKDPDRGRAVSSYLKWVYSSGQLLAQEQGYATLPQDVLDKVVAKAATIH